MTLRPTAKPVALVAAAILDVPPRAALVLDPFGGSGTTLIAAEKTGRVTRLIEFDPLYCDVIIRRFEAYTGKRAKLAATGEAFRRCRCGTASRENRDLTRVIRADTTTANREALYGSHGKVREAGQDPINEEIGYLVVP